MELSRHGERFEGLVETLLQLAYFHRAAAHVLAGWSPKIAGLELKTETARHIFEDIEQSQRLNGHIFAITRGSGIKNLIPDGWRTLMRAIDGAPSADAMLLAVYGVVKRHVHGLYAQTMAELDPILDATLSYVIPPHQVLLSRQLAWAAGVLPERMTAEAALLAAEIEQLWGERHRGALIAPEDAIWAPLDRVPNAARPAGMPRGLPGSLRVLPLDSAVDRAGIGMFLHNLINGEYTTMELASRSLYEHPDMPPAFQLHMARQISDEARHARAIEALALDYGVRYGDYPAYTLTYDGYYQFEPCAPGSKRELMWRLLIRGTIDEGLALDDFAFQVKRREHLAQPRLADLFRYLLADEVFHAQSALKWSRYLAGGDEAKTLAEREAANAYVNEMVDGRRREFVSAHPDAALAEVRHTREVVAEESKNPLPFDREINAAARKEAGFSDGDLAQAIRWGYVKAP